MVIIILACLNPLSSSELDALPCMEDCTMDLASDLELPGFPTRKSGIRNSMQITIMKTFSRRAAFLAMFGPNVMLSSSTSWQLRGKDDEIDVSTTEHELRCEIVNHDIK